MKQRYDVWVGAGLAIALCLLLRWWQGSWPVVYMIFMLIFIPLYVVFRRGKQ